MSFDVVVRGGELLDGTGRARYRGDIGIEGSTITAVGQVDGQGAVEVDAEGCFVAPGFIDGHTHMDAQVHWDPLATCPSWHGVTTMVMGNCGFTLAPCRETEIDLVLRSLERAEDIARDTMLAGITWDWETFPEFLDNLERLPKAVNYAGYIGHSALRTYVMGERAYDGPATDDDLAAMQDHLRRSIEAGAIGFSTSCSSNHETSDDRPVASRLADWSELVTLVGVLTELGAGVFQLAPVRTTDPDEHHQFAERLGALAVESGRPVTFMVGGEDKMLDLLDDIAVRGGHLVGQVHSREYLNVMGFRVGLPFDRLSGWAELRSRPLAEQAAALGDPGQRARLVDEALHGRYGRQVGPTRAPSFDQLRVFDSPDGPYRTVGELAQGHGTTPVDVMIDLSLASGFDQLFAQPIMGSTLDGALAGLQHPHTVVAASDSGAHVTQITDSSIPTYLLSHWVRREEAFTWEEGVRMLTSVPAALWGFDDRGIMAQGRRADLVIFDPLEIGPAMPTVEHDLPGGGRRLVQRAHGIRSVLVNGVETLRDGEPTGRLPGRLLRSTLTGQTN